MNMYDSWSATIPLKTNSVIWHQFKNLTETNLELARPQYRAWAQHLRRSGAMPIEFILPRLELACENVLPLSMQAAELRFARNPELGQELSQNNYGYYFYLGGGLSTVDKKPAAKELNRETSIVRIQAINGVVEDIVGANKKSMTVLDFASNWGGMAIDLGMRGFGSVSGFDFKEQNVRRAVRLRDYMGADNVVFKRANVFDLPIEYREGFDVVLNLGLLYHVVDPVRLAQITYQLARKIAVFDTLAHREPFSGYIQGIPTPKGFGRPGMGEQPIELHPTYRGLVDLLKFVGFSKLVEVVPRIGPEFLKRQENRYYNHLRRIIIAFK